MPSHPTSKLPYFSSTTTQFSELNLLSDSQEKTQRGTSDFPCCAYICDFSKFIAGIYPMHWHPELQFTAAGENPLIVSVGGNNVLLESGEGIFINTKVFHSIAPALPGSCERMDIIFNPELLFGSYDNVFYHKYLYPILQCRNLSYVKLSPDDKSGEKILSCFWRSFTSCQRQDTGFEIFTRNDLSVALLEIYNLYGSTLKQNSAAHKARETRVHQMVNYIYSNYAARITLSDIASSALVSERECSRCFNEILNVSPIHFLKRHRVAAAISLMEKGDDSIETIGYQCGFNSPSYFIKTFKEFTSCTPGEYMRRLKTEN